MNAAGRDRRRRWARRAAIVAGGLALVCIAWLAVGAIGSRLAAPAEQQRVEELVGQVKTDATVAADLDGERERQTAASLRRETRDRIAAWVLLFAAAGFVAAGKWYGSLSPRERPVLPHPDGVGAVSAPDPESTAGPSAPAASGSTPLLSIEPGLDLSAVDALVERFGRAQEAAIPILQGIQQHYRFLPDEALQRVCALTEITPAQLAGTSSFYAQFRRSPVGRHVVRICHGTACHVAGADTIERELRRYLGIAEGADTDGGRRVTLDAVACVGCCSLAPVLMVEDDAAGRLTPATARQVIDDVVAS